MVDVRDGAVLPQHHVQAVGLVVFGDHLTGLDDAALLRKVLFAEDLWTRRVPLASVSGRPEAVVNASPGDTYRLGVRLF